MTHTLVIGFGSNIGDRLSYINDAKLYMKEEFGEPIKESSIYVSPPHGFESKNDFFNCCCVYSTSISAQESLAITQSIEKKIGRKKKSVDGMFSSRKIDIDILYYDDLIFNSQNLTIPHYAVSERIFVLKPLNEIIPDFIDPVLNKTVVKLYENCPKSTCFKKKVR